MIVVGAILIRAEIVAHVVPALDELGEVVDEVLDDALLVGHDSLVQRGVPVVVPRLKDVRTLISFLNSVFIVHVHVLCVIKAFCTHCTYSQY